jgi:long-subunit acyl-CoA synthetase (AMP-forming)
LNLTIPKQIDLQNEDGYVINKTNLSVIEHDGILPSCPSGGTDAPTGVLEEFDHRTPHVMSGYYKDVENPNQAFNDGWFHSGDLEPNDTGLTYFYSLCEE